MNKLQFFTTYICFTKQLQNSPQKLFFVYQNGLHDSVKLLTVPKCFISVLIYLNFHSLTRIVDKIGTNCSSQRSFGVLISRGGKNEQRSSEPRRDWGEEMVKSSPFSRLAALVVLASPNKLERQATLAIIVLESNMGKAFV